MPSTASSDDQLKCWYHHFPVTIPILLQFAFVSDHHQPMGAGVSKTASGEFDDRFDLFAVKAIEPFHDVVDACPCFKI